MTSRSSQSTAMKKPITWHQACRRPRARGQSGSADTLIAQLSRPSRLVIWGLPVGRERRFPPNRRRIELSQCKRHCCARSHARARGRRRSSAGRPTPPHCAPGRLGSQDVPADCPGQNDQLDVLSVSAAELRLADDTANAVDQPATVATRGHRRDSDVPAAGSRFAHVSTVRRGTDGCCVSGSVGSDPRNARFRRSKSSGRCLALT